MKLKTKFALLLLLSISFLVHAQQKKDFDPLSSWNNGTTRQSIIDFVNKTTKVGSADFVPVADRIACFDNDGTLWSEQPMYFPLVFAFDRVKALAPLHPEWKEQQPFKAVLEGDMKTVFAGGMKSLLQIMMATYTGMTGEEFEKTVKEWFATAIHPKTGKHFNEMIFQPMVELLNYLRANGYKTFIVTGGEIDFTRVLAEQVYGIPPDQVVGTSFKVKYDTIGGKPVINRLPELNFFNDKDAKPVGIYQYIGKRPVFTAGNSDGDYAMLQYTSTGSGPRFGMYVHHTDSLREYFYDREPGIAQLNRGLDDAAKYHWLIVDMKTDWKKIYPFEK
jgi:phosphoserine phosphatase